MIISQYGQPAAKPPTILDRFDRVAKQTESLTGHPLAFAAAVCFVAIWAMTGCSSTLARVGSLPLSP